MRERIDTVRNLNWKAANVHLMLLVMLHDVGFSIVFKQIMFWMHIFYLVVHLCKTLYRHLLPLYSFSTECLLTDENKPRHQTKTSTEIMLRFGHWTHHNQALGSYRMLDAWKSRLTAEPTTESGQRCINPLLGRGKPRQTDSGVNQSAKGSKEQ